MGKDAIIKTKCGHMQTRSPGTQLEEELKRHFNGAITSIVKWSKTMEKQIKHPKHESQHPQDQVAVEARTSSLENK